MRAADPSALSSAGPPGPPIPKRSMVVDVVRGLAITLVALGHVNQGTLHRLWWADVHRGRLLNNAIYSFHMPAFFFVTGVFLCASVQKRGRLHFFLNKLQIILYPYILWTIIVAVGTHVLHRFMVSPPWTFHKFAVSLITGNEFWFLPTIFLVLMLAMMLYRLPLPAVFAVSALAGMFWHFLHINDIDLAVHNLPFTVAGMWIGRRVERIEHVPRYACLLIAAALGGVIAALAPFAPSASHFLALPAGLIGCAMLLCAASALGRGAIARAFARTGEASFGVFLLAAYPQGLCREVLVRVFHTTALLPQLVLTTAFSVAASVLVYRYRERLRIGWLFTWPWRRRDKRPANQPIAASTYSI